MKRAAPVLLAMTWWWLLPFCARDLATHPFLPFFPSHLLYLVTLAHSLLCALVLDQVDQRTNFWARRRYWGRLAIVGGAYAIQMASLVAVLVALDARGGLKYYGGDAGGSVGLLFLPSIPAYFVLGGVFGLVREVFRRICSARAGGRGPPPAG